VTYHTLYETADCLGHECPRGCPALTAWCGVSPCLPAPAVSFEINLSVPLVYKYEEVLPQQLHATELTTTDIAEFLDYFCTIAHHHEIFFLWRPMLTDPQDEMLLELAVKARCPYIVTYNTRNFQAAEQFGIAIVTPKAFLEAIGV
jgi:predicted nucleic acid-binding protein